MAKTERVVIYPRTSYVPVEDIECIDKSQEIWKGKIVKNPSSKAAAPDDIVFSRRYDKENDIDKVLVEYEFKEEHFGFAFWMIPIEKVLFSFLKPGMIALPDHRLIGGKPRRMN